MDKMVVGLPWYRKEEYTEFRDASEDADLFEDTYEEWLALSEDIERMLRKDGTRTVRVCLDLKTFPAWCRRHRMPMDAGARAHYAAEQVRLQFPEG